VVKCGDRCLVRQRAPAPARHPAARRPQAAPLAPPRPRGHAQAAMPAACQNSGRCTGSAQRQHPAPALWPRCVRRMFMCSISPYGSKKGRSASSETSRGTCAPRTHPRLSAAARLATLQCAPRPLHPAPMAARQRGNAPRCAAVWTGSWHSPPPRRQSGSTEHRANHTGPASREASANGTDVDRPPSATAK